MSVKDDDVLIDRRNLMLFAVGAITGFSFFSSSYLFSQIRRVSSKQSLSSLALPNLTNKREPDVLIFSPRGQVVISLLYDGKTMSAPVVVEKAGGPKGLEMLEKALSEKISLYQDDKLSMRTLRRAKVGEPIPRKAYKPVAEVFAKVYQARHEGLRQLIHIVT